MYDSRDKQASNSCEISQIRLLLLLSIHLNLHLPITSQVSMTLLVRKQNNYWGFFGVCVGFF